MIGKIIFLIYKKLDNSNPYNKNLDIFFNINFEVETTWNPVPLPYILQTQREHICFRIPCTLQTTIGL